MRYLVVHGHLYQPPRENPWTELIERQPSASPFHDWNERVSDECYERLGGAGVRGPDGRIVALVNLFGRLSFNIGPTLAGWLEAHRPSVLDDARAGFEASLERTGRPAALMQPYGHAILPLCDAREKALQIAWGKADFVRRFGREPEGIWFSETAIDLPSLEAAAEQGLRYTIVAPEQVRRIRRIGDQSWTDVSSARVPPHRPYLVRLPSGRTFTIFVFDSVLSRNAAFGGILDRGDALMNAFRGALDGVPEDEDGLVLLAADGETFGHHQRGAEEVLAEGLVRSRLSASARVTHLGEVLHALEPAWEAEVVSPSSWSCSHGVDRWARGCSCGDTSLGPDWSRSWRAVLRRAVHSFRDRVFALVDRRGRELFRDPWEAATAYGSAVVLPPDLERVQALVDDHGKPGLDEGERARAAKLLELIRQTLFSATSCGWFFDDIAGIEATQVLRHLARAIELLEEVFGIEAKQDILNILARARSNHQEAGTGADILERQLRRATRGASCALRHHALRRLESALAGNADGSTASTRFGVFGVSDAAPVTIESEKAGFRVAGRAEAVHLRTGERMESAFSVEEPEPGAEIALALDETDSPEVCASVREALLRLTAARSMAELPAIEDALITRRAWIGRQARALGIPLPPPFPEAMRGGARALLARVIEGEPTGSGEVLAGLERALEACSTAGLDEQDLEDLRPSLDMLLAVELTALVRRADADELERCARVLERASDVAGQIALARSRRIVVRGSVDLPRPQRLRLARACGMTADALARVDEPLRIPSEIETDALL